VNFKRKKKEKETRKKKRKERHSRNLLVRHLADHICLEPFHNECVISHTLDGDGRIRLVGEHFNDSIEAAEQTLSLQ
jgi:hypothetical protein